MGKNPYREFYTLSKVKASLMMGGLFVSTVGGVEQFVT
jgi:hypothetical protein